MEGMNREIFEMITNLQDIRCLQRANAAKTGGKDPYGFSFEPADSFSLEPLGFLKPPCGCRPKRSRCTGLPWNSTAFPRSIFRCPHCWKK